jgi:hypothetical protein
MAVPNSHQQGFRFASSFSMNPQAMRNADSRLQQRQRNIFSSPERHATLSPSAEEVLATGKKTSTRKPRFTRFGIKRKQDDHDPSAIHMTFIGTKHVTTPSVPLPGTAPLLDDYFSMQEYRALLFPNNNATVFDGPISDELFATWCREAELGGATGPTLKTNGGILELYNSETEKQQIMKITAVLQMPSLQIRSESIIGVKLLLSKRDKSNDVFPELQFTLLDSQLIPDGTSVAAKWIFNQLMKYRDSTSSFTRVTAERTDERQIAFTTDARLETRIHIPSSILKFLPTVDVAKFEQTGSESIQKLLEKDLEPALLGFRNAFKTFSEKVEVAVLQLKP